MKRGTKIITTVIALVLVLSFMVVGILAATSATAGITATVSWTAEEGISFTIDAWTYYSAEHYDKSSKTFPEVSSHQIDTITVNTATTNQEASGISKSLNANFVDVTDDGVNNPKELYYIYIIREHLGLAYLNVLIENFPESTENIQIDYYYYDGVPSSFYKNGICPEVSLEQYAVTKDVIRRDRDTFGVLFAMKLTVLTPDISFDSFDVSVGFRLENGFPILIAP